MKTKNVLKLGISLGVGCMLMTASAGATTIGTLFQLNGGGTQDYTVTNNGVSDTLTASSQVGFLFSNSLLPTPFGGAERDATLTLSATTFTLATDNGVTIDQVGYAGSFSIKDNILGTILLAGSFNNGDLGGSTGGHSATFSGSLPPDSVTFTSDYLDFSLSTTNQAFSFSLTNVTPSLTTTALRVNTANAAGSGVFSAAPIPQTQSPEPATMALFGTGLTGFALLLRRRKV